MISGPYGPAALCLEHLCRICELSVMLMASLQAKALRYFSKYYKNKMVCGPSLRFGTPTYSYNCLRPLLSRVWGVGPPFAAFHRGSAVATPPFTQIYACVKGIRRARDHQRHAAGHAERLRPAALRTVPRVRPDVPGAEVKDPRCCHESLHFFAVRSILGGS